MGWRAGLGEDDMAAVFADAASIARELKDLRERQTFLPPCICLSRKNDYFRGMEPAKLDLNATLSTLGWTGAELARRVDVGADRVSAWRRGKAKLPGSVVAYLDLALKARELLT
jgi:hypothetical protein